MPRPSGVNLSLAVIILLLGGVIQQQRDDLREFRSENHGPTPPGRGPVAKGPASVKVYSQTGPTTLYPNTPEGAATQKAQSAELVKLREEVGQLRTALLAKPATIPTMNAWSPLMDSFLTPAEIASPPDPATLKGPNWNHAQATGSPDTIGAGDLPTAWAPRHPKSGEQWLQLGYDSAVEISAVNVRETYHPGALSKVTALLPDGTERELWKGQSQVEEGPVETSVPVPQGITSNMIRVYVDTNRVESWPEIDAVELVGADGSRQWASSSIASSSYGESSPSPAGGNR